MLKNKIFTFILVSIFSSFLYSCDTRKEKEAMLHIVQARILYKDKQLEEAKEILDSLPFKYPYAYKAKSFATHIADSVDRDIYRVTVDSLDEIIGEYRYNLYSLNTDEQREMLRISIDSLENEQQPFLDSITSINRKEAKYFACRQCVTFMRNR